MLVQDPTDSHKNLTVEVVEQIKTKFEEKAYLIVRHYWTNRLMFVGWADGPEYRVRLTWLA